MFGVLTTGFTVAQSPAPDLKTVNEQTLSFFEQGKWKSLDSLGQIALKSGIDFPLLRMRIGYAAFMRGRYDRSFVQYNKALKQDPANDAVLELQTLNNIYLGRTEAAEYFMGKLSETTRAAYARKPFELVDAIDAEGGVMMPSDADRYTGATFRAGLRSRINWRWSVYQSYGYFSQKANGQLPGTAPAGAPKPTLTVSQSDYFIRTKYQAAPRIGIWLGYHWYGYNVSVDRMPPAGIPNPAGNYAGSIIMSGINLTVPRVSIDIFNALGIQDSMRFNQHSITARYYPFGNTALYFIFSGNLQTSNNGMQKFVGVPGIGFKPTKKLWIEAGYYVFRDGFNNLYENEGVYVENAYDGSKFRSSASLSYMLNKHVFLRVNGIYEHKFYLNNSTSLQVNYNQPTITGGIVWKR